MLPEMSALIYFAIVGALGLLNPGALLTLIVVLVEAARDRTAREPPVGRESPLDWLPVLPGTAQARAMRSSKNRDSRNITATTQRRKAFAYEVLVSRATADTILVGAVRMMAVHQNLRGQ